jgi:beta-lactamase superfamily II metal-dependent hydrolase
VPSVVAPGDRVEAKGNGFDDALMLTLEAAGLQVQLQNIAVDVDAGRAYGTVPNATPAGTYRLVARTRGRSASLDGIAVRTSGVRVHFLDVGQGDATLVVAPGGETLLIDGGPLDRSMDVARSIDAFAHGRLDAVVLSHTDADHLGGLVGLLSGLDGVAGTADDIVPTTRLAGADDGTCMSQLCVRARALQAWPFTVAKVGDSIPLGDAEVAIVAVDGDVGDGTLPGTDSENERSVVVRIRYAGRNVLITGDVTGGGNGDADVEGPLARKTGPIDVLRVAHHGSATSSNAEALAVWNPRALVLSLGTDNAYCHPAPEVIARLRSTEAVLLSTGSGIVDDAARCGEATHWPDVADVGLGNIVLEMGNDGSLVLQGEAL